MSTTPDTDIKVSIRCECPCGKCGGEPVTVELGDFWTTEAKVAACSVYRSQGIVAWHCRKSAALNWRAAA